MFLFETEEFTGELTGSEEGEMTWIPRNRLHEYKTVDDLQQMLDVILKPELTEFQYIIEDGNWLVKLF